VYLRFLLVLHACLCACLCAGLLAGCSPSREGQAANPAATPIRAQGFHLDTVITITIYDSQDQGLFQDVFDEISRLEGILSVTAPGSDPDRLAKNAGGDYIEVSDDTLYLINESAKFSVMSDGAFDCTVGPLVSLWGIRDTSGHFPSENELKETLSLIGYQDVLIRNGNLVMLKKAGMETDFGAIAKGYIADRLKELLAGKGVGSAVIDLGGNIVLLGEKPGGEAYRIGVRDPFGGDNEYFGVFEIADKSLVTSGSYERFFIHEGKAYHHIFDVVTGFPADNELVQTTIISDSSTEGEGYSTTAFLLGLERGLALVNDAEGVEAVFVTKEKKVYVTSGIKDNFVLTSQEYEFADGPR